jgi:hypothetical protein
MALPLPNLDDKSFLRIVEEARTLIPSTAPEWTDHNIHDPGITFIDLFAWLAEIEHYRLNNTSAFGSAQFFSLIGLTPLGQQPAEVTIALASAAADFLPANSRVSAIGHELVPFESTRDVFLTTAALKKVITFAGEREIVQTRAQVDEVAHYEAFGLSPAVDDSLELGFENWFDEPQGHLTITLFEDDLPLPQPFATDAKGFVSSAQLVWEQLTPAGWAAIEVIEDKTLNLSRSGDLIFRIPQQASVERGLRWLRARIVKGHYEIPPRILRIQTSTVRARQVQTIVNEDLGKGLGEADQEVRLQKYPVFLAAPADRPFQAGDVLEWDELIKTLSAEPGNDARSKEIAYVADKLKKFGVNLDPSDPLEPEEKYALAQAFDQLISAGDFYDRRVFGDVPQQPAFADALTRPESCQAKSSIRLLNRLLLERLFRDQIVSDRIELQTAKDDAWTTWQRVETFAESGPNDNHYRLDTETGRIFFGNGLNGHIPQTTELIRARFYRYSQADRGNLNANLSWLLAVRRDNQTVNVSGQNSDVASGGQGSELLDDSRLRAREIFRKQSPVLTTSDYERLVLRTPGLRVARVKVLPNFNPNVRCVRLSGDVTVIVVPSPPPAASFPDAAPPKPSAGFLKTVENHLDRRRLVTTNLHVIGPEYVPVKVSCRVFLKKRVSESEAHESVIAALKQLLDPIFGGPERGKGWPFGRSVFPSEINQRLAQLPAVDYVVGVRLNDLKPGESLPLAYNQLPMPGTPDVRLIPFERRGEREIDSRDEGACD